MGNIPIGTLYGLVNKDNTMDPYFEGKECVVVEGPMDRELKNRVGEVCNYNGYLVTVAGMEGKWSAKRVWLVPKKLPPDPQVTEFLNKLLQPCDDLVEAHS